MNAIMIRNSMTYIPENKDVCWRIFIYDKATKNEYTLSYHSSVANSEDFDRFVTEFISHLMLKRNRVFIGIYTEKIEENACYNDFMRFISGNSRKWSGVRYCPRI